MISGARNRFSGTSAPVSSVYSPGTSSTIVETNTDRSSSPTLSSTPTVRMSGKDRTSEFMSAVQMLHSPQVSGYLSVHLYNNP